MPWFPKRWWRKSITARPAYVNGRTVCSRESPE